MKEKKGKNRKITLAQVYDMDNIRTADREARKGKTQKYGVRKFDRHHEENLQAIAESIRNRTFHTMPPIFEERFCEHKTRILSKVHYPYHVAHHALMRIIMPVLMRSYYYESAASIEGRGIHYSAGHVRKWIDSHKSQPLWWVQVDFTKFYHHINRQKIYDRLCHTFNDPGIRWMLHDIIWAMGNHNGLEPSDGTEGMGIGLYPVQPLVNYYLNDFDREVARFKCFYSRYCDNLLLIGDNPKELWRAVNFIRNYAANTLCQPIHTNIGVQRLDQTHPVDYCGYLFYTDHTFIRKRTKHQFKKRYTETINDPEQHRQVLSAYKGWLQHCNGMKLWQKVTNMKSFKELNIKRNAILRDGKRYFDVPLTQASSLVNREITVKDFEEDVQTKNGSRVCVLVEENKEEKKFITNNPRMKDILQQVREMNEFPFTAMLRSRIIGNKTDYYFE